MQRDSSLVPLSRQHFHVLALCMRIHRRRGTPADWRREMLSLWEEDVRFHFQAEEKYLFPAARCIASLAPLVRQLRADHVRLRRAFAAARRRVPSGSQFTRFADLLEAHVRKEERVLFEECQRKMPAGELAALGALMEEYFRKRGSNQSCRVSP